MTPLVTPTVHLNGTSAQELVQQRIDVIEAAQALQEAMKRAMPNDRDYYPQGEDAGLQARRAWIERMDPIIKLVDELQMDAMKIALQAAK